MNIKWYGHSCFLLTATDGTAILTDPCPKSVGYDIHDVACDAVTVSHEHFDHNYIAAAKDSPVIIRGPGESAVNGTRIIGIDSYHDDNGGCKRGSNTMFLYEIDDMRILHAGDIGHLLSDETVEIIGSVDVLLVPVGGKYTLNYAEARRFANQLKPSVVIPMHYRTARSTLLDIDDVNSFISTARDCKIHRLNDCEATISRGSLGEDRVLVLDPYMSR